jgi:hypothetical protein
MAARQPEPIGGAIPFAFDTGLLREAAYYAALAVVAGLLLWRRPARDLSRRGAVALGAAWVAVWSLEYWIFGPASFLHYYDEGDVFVPIWLHQAAHPGIGAFDHAIAGGSDSMTLAQAGGEHVSLQRLLLGALPLWVAILVHKVSVCWVGLAGSYVLCRRRFGCDRLTSLAIGAAFTVGHAYLVITTVHHGIGYAAIPLAAYLVVARAEKERYHLPVAILAAALAVNVTPTHAFLALAAGVALAAFLLDVRRWMRVVAALAILCVAVLLNWHDAFYAIASYVGESNRVGVGSREIAAAAIVETGFIAVASKITWPYLLGGAAAAAALVWRGDPMGWRAVLALMAAIFGGAALNALPWAAVGLGPLGSIRFTNIHFAYPALMVPILARLAAGAPRAEDARRSAPRRIVLAGMAAVAVGSLAWFKLFNAVNFLGEGGQTVLTSIDNLRNAAWAPKEPFRVVTVPYRLPPNALLAYGFETLDGYLAMHPWSRARFWKDALEKTGRADLGPDPGPARYTGGDLYIATYNVDYRCCASFDLSSWVDVRFLRLANVGFVISRVPLTGEGIRKVSGPPDWTEGRRSLPMSRKLEGDIAEIFDPEDAFVYAVADQLPRAYFARGVAVAAAGTSPRDFFAEVGRLGLDRGVVLDGASRPPRSAVGGAVTGIRRPTDAYEIDVAAPDGGLLVLNVFPVRFWRAEIDGRPAPILTVNGFQMGVEVPPGAVKVRFAYARPTLTSAVAASIERLL